MTRVFIDTWGWVAFAHGDDNYHQEVLSFYENLRYKKGIPVTTDYVLAETINLLRKRTGSASVSVFVEALLYDAREGQLQLMHINESRWRQAWEMSKKYGDKPGISFTDFSSWVVMKELGIKKALTADRHFEEVALGFRKLF